MSGFRWGALLGAALPLVALGGCVYGPPPPSGPVVAAVPPPPPPPAPVFAAPPPPPPGAFVWRRAHWFWNGYRYVWVPGHYAPVPG